MLVESAVARTHRAELDAGHPHLPERLDALFPLFGTAPRRREPTFNRHRGRITSLLLDQTAERIHRHAAVVVRRNVSEPAIGDLRDAPRHGLDDRALLSIPATAEPDRDRPLYRQRIQARAIDAVPATCEVHDLLCPQRTQNGDLLLDALAAVREAHAK